MDVFDLIGGERSDISDWEDGSDEESNEGLASSDQEPSEEMNSVQENNKSTGNNSSEGPVHQQAAYIAGSESFMPVDVSAFDTAVDKESAVEESLKDGTLNDDKDCVQGDAPPPLQSKDGDALNLFTINPVSKEDAKNYAPLLGMHSGVEPAGGDTDESAAGNDASPTAALSDDFSPRRATIPFLDAHPELDVLVLDNVLSERECARIVATVRGQWQVLCLIMLARAARVGT